MASVRREREHSVLEYDAGSKTLSFKYDRSDAFEQRVVECETQGRRTEGIIRIHDITCRIYASLHIPSLPGREQDHTASDRDAYNELIERAAIIRGDDEIRQLKVDAESHPGRPEYSTERYVANVDDADFLWERARIVALPKLAGEMVRYAGRGSVRAWLSGWVPGAQGRVLENLVRGTDLAGPMELIQDIYEDDARRESRNHGFSVYFQDLSWVLRQYQKGLTFIFQGQRGEVEDSLAALIGSAPLRRIEIADEARRERERLEQSIAESIKDIRMGKTCGYCREDFVRGDTKVQDTIHARSGARETEVDADFHAGCHGEYQAQRSGPQGKRRENAQKEKEGS